MEAIHLTCTGSVRGEGAMKEQLESVVLQMYRAGIRCAERSKIWRLTSALHEQRGGVDHRGRSFQCRRCVDVQRSNTLTAYLDLVISYSRLPEISCRVVAVRCGLVPD